MNVIALDLGTTTGYACNVDDAHFYGEILLATPKELREQTKTRGNRRGDLRVERLFWWLRYSGTQWRPQVVVFEDVQFASSTYQTQLWSSLRTAVWLAFSRSYSAPIIDCVPVQTLKKFATGAGGADKAAMIVAARLAPGKFDIRPKLSDNEADALALHKWAQAHYNL